MILQPTKTQAIKSFLTAKTHEDLSSLYTHDMEVQVVVAQDDGEIMTNEFHGRKRTSYTDGDTIWSPIRIPRNAMSEPEYEDHAIKFDLGAHAEGIGMTGWNWFDRVSKWVAFDFDAIYGHSSKHQRKADTDELKEIKEIAMEIPWVTVRHSTSGKGLHLYVFLDDVPTSNHTEHAALARAILAQMSGLVGYDFSTKVDICGGNMWVWHRKMERNPNGLTLIKQGTTLTDPPKNWRQHIQVTSNRSTKISNGLGKDGNAPENLATQFNKAPLEDEHRKLIKWLHDNSRFFWWDADHHMLVTHTIHLRDAHDELNFKGIFKTNSEGQDLNTQNCFLFPTRGGAWSVRRYSLGTEEHPSWEQDGKLWTRCYYNVTPDLKTACLAHNGLEDPSGGFVFNSLVDAKEAGRYIGADIKTPPGMDGRSVTIKPHKDGRRVVAEFKRESGDLNNNLPGWLEKSGKWVKVFDASLSTNKVEIDVQDYDDLIRHLVSYEGADSGWVINADSTWHDEPLNHVRAGLESMSLKPFEVKAIIGSSVFKPWKLTVRPFEPEYPGDREWNRRAPQFRFTPSDRDDLQYPTWNMILNHIGKNLDYTIMQDEWCKKSGVLSGSDYLKCWLASMIQHPYEPLPYLFVYGETQATGKSMFHEAASLLFEPGYCRADQAINPKSEFNGELEGSILCVIEETNLNGNEKSYNKIKDWTTSRRLPIRRLYQTAYHVPNTTHWVQCANHRSYCPIFPGDTRITMVHVPERPGKTIPKRVLIEMLESEASDFLSELLRLEIPETTDRLRIPAISSSDKMTAEEASRSMLEVFLDEHCFYAPGYYVSLAEFFEKFTAWLDPNERLNWSTKQRVSAKMPIKFPKGRLPSDPSWYWGNISFTEPEEERAKLITFDQKLIPEA